MTSTTLSHLWRFARLFGLTFGGSLLANLSHLPSTDKTAILGAAVAAVEVAYRKTVPGNPNGIQWVGQLIQAFKVISSVNAQPAVPAAPGPVSTVGPGPVVGPPVTPPSPS